MVISLSRRVISEPSSLCRLDIDQRRRARAVAQAPHAAFPPTVT